ncbi:MAG: phage portal protein [Devosia sp.]|uniref:phage portal protein n=1 Tax=Devosia sp. 66-22 TaxID=1895753 RepID=UPI000927CC34|nr:phage portal protein [Devosia sp. 66-22]MBN9347555.1 phage portal protein [Devosia sp.]OJX50670.1 MAG: phage portal protein [Devosia sp. 66-22]
MRLGNYILFEKKQTDAEILEMLGGGVETSAGVQVSPDSALRVPAVAAAVRTISEAAACLRIGVVSIAADGTETPQPSNDVHKLLNGDVNDWTSGFELVRQLMVDALCRDPGGLAWVNRSSDNRILEIVRYAPGIIGCEYAPDGSGRPVTYRINGRPTPPSDIIHLKGTFDKSAVTLAREAIGIAVVMQKHAARLFGKGARPGGVIQMLKGLGDEGAKRMLKGWKAALEGAENAGKTGVLWDGATWQQMTLNSVDAQFQQLWLFIIQDLARCFNIPAVVIGEMSRATWSNSAEMQRLFLMLCLEPWLKAIEASFTRALFPKSAANDNERFAVRIERDDFSKVDLAVLATAINSLVASRVLNPNEGRDWIRMPKGPAELDKFANPNTGASQPGTPPNPSPKPDPEDEERDAA